MTSTYIQKYFYYYWKDKHKQIVKETRVHFQQNFQKYQKHFCSAKVAKFPEAFLFPIKRQSILSIFSIRMNIYIYIYILVINVAREHHVE